MTTFSQQVTWTVLPNGFNPKTGNLRFSLHIAPRLMSSDASTTLGPGFANWIDWPTTLVGPSGAWGDPAGVSFEIKFGGGASIPVTPVSDAPKPSPWTALFSSSTPVSSFTPLDLTPRYIRSYPAHHIRDFARGTYQGLTTTFPTAPPTAHVQLNGFKSGNTNLNYTPLGMLSPAGATGDGLGAPMGGNSGFYTDIDPDNPTPPLPRPAISNGTEVNLLNPLGNNVSPGAPNSGWVGQVKQMLASAPNHAISGTGAADPQSDFTQQYLYHQPFPATASGPQAPGIDFHQMLGHLGAHPALLRLLGLVVDFEVAPPSPAPTSAMMVVGNSPTTGSTVTPGTACFFGTNEFGPDQFIAASRPGSGADIANGALPFDDDTAYTVIEVDPDSAGLHLFNHSRAAYRAINVMQSDDTPLAPTPPSLRSPGFSVSHLDWAVRQYLNFQSQNSLESAGPTPTVYAEDLTRGYYIHAFTPLHGVWHSLGMRTGAYTFGSSGPTFSVEDEAAMTLSPTSDPRVDLREPMTPDGDSNDMSIPPAIFHWNGWSLAAARPGNPDVQQSPSIMSDPSFPVTIAYRAQPGTLPLLRYGQTYQFRARAADLAGNCLPFGSYDAGNQDPHATPAWTFGRFEAISQPATLLTAPPTPGESAERIVIRSNYNTPATATSARHLVPPRTAQLMAELSGAFDTANGIDPHAYNEIVQLADGTLAGANSATPLPGATVAGSFYYPTNNLNVPYLPDVYARGAALLDLPGTPSGTVQKVPFIPAGQAWPHYVPVRLVLQEGTAAPSYQAMGGGEGVLTVSIPKGQVQPVQLSSYLDAGDLNSMGQWIWTSTTPGLGSAASLQAMATQGQMWALTPFRELILVHAVQQPLATPEFSPAFDAVKTDFGQTYADLIDTMSWDRASTSKVHVAAKWVEYLDAGPGGAPPTQVPGAGKPPLDATAGAIAFDVNQTIGNLRPAPSGPPDGVVVMETQLQATGTPTTPGIALNAGGTYTAITVAGLPQPVSNGDALIISYSGYEQEVTVNNPGGYAAGDSDVTITVLPFTANYDYPMQDAALPAPATGTVNFPGTVVTDPVWSATTLPLFQRQEFRDTKYRLITYEAEATTAFADYFYETTEANLTTQHPTEVNASGFVPGTVRVLGVPGAAPINGALNGVTFVDANHGWAAANNGTVLVTYNGGDTWYRFPVGSQPALNLTGISFSDINTGFASGQNGQLLTTVNGGEAWSTLASTPVNLNDISFVDANRGWGVGPNGAIIATTNGGTTWATQASGTNQNLNGVSFINSTDGWAVGQNGTLLTTTNGGTTWTALAAPGQENLTGVSFVDTDRGWVVGQNGLILVTTDGGQTWTEQASPTNQNLTGVAFVESMVLNTATPPQLVPSGRTEGWAVAQNGAVFFTTQGGANWIQQPLVYSPSTAPVTTTALTSNLSANTPYATLPVAPLTEPVLVGATVTVGTGSTASTGGSTAPAGTAPTSIVTVYAPVGATHLVIQPLTPTADIQQNTTVFVTGGDWVEEDSTGALALTANTSIPNNTNVQVTFLPSPITRLGAPATIPILSSDRPAAPSVVNTVPTFGWNQVISGTGITSTKTGGTIRVYLDRPWWSSGGDELLGVVLWHGPAAGETTPNQFIAPYVTQAGNDPVHGSPNIPLTYSLAVSDFPLAAATQLDTTVDELPTTMRFDDDKAVDVAGHTVQYDAARDLWYSDIEVDLPKSYWPYVRLALCRFQPNSINRSLPGGSSLVGSNLDDDAYISRVVLADFMQLAPNRTATVTQTLAPPIQVNVKLTGLSYSTVDAGTGQGSSTTGPSLVYLSLEQELSSFSSDLAWQPVTVGGSPMVSEMMVASYQADGQTTWTGAITLPTTGGTFRLVLEEYEVYPTDSLTASQAGSGSPGGPGLRLVHTDIINLGLERPGVPLDAAGQHGTLIQSNTLGATWASLASSTGNDLYDVDVVTGTTAVAVGNNGTIVGATTGGSSWSAQTSGTTRNLFGVSFADVNHGWVVGQQGTILSTGNGGTTWAAQTGPTTQDLMGVSFSDSLHGWAVGKNGVVMSTTDGGISGPGSWALQSAGTTQQLNGVSFPNSSSGWAVGNGGVIIATSNGGSSWAAQKSGTTQNLAGVFFSDPQHGWVVGQNGLILATSNGGSTWTKQTSGTNQNLNGVAFFNPVVGIAVGQSGLVLITSDGGQTWYTPLPPNANLAGVSFVSPTQGWAVGQNGLIQATTNGGSDWTTLASGTNQNLNDVSFSTAGKGWVVGQNGVILNTQDGGQTWSPQSSPVNQNLVGVSFVNTTTGFAVSGNGTLLSTTNGGATWTKISALGLPGNVTGLAFTTAVNGWAVAGGGVIVATTNGGTSWAAQTSGTNRNLSGVSFVGASGWAVGDNGTILNTTSGGATWASQSSGTNQRLNSVSFSDPSNGFATGANGTVVATSNGGTLWTVVGEYPTNQNLLGTE